MISVQGIVGSVAARNPIESQPAEITQPFLSQTLRKLSGQRIWFYSSDRFLLSAKQYLEAQIDEKVIREVGARLTQKREEDEAKLAKPVVPEFDSVNEEKLSPSSAEKLAADRDEDDS
ncbi:MAG TPA: hypothetical protein VMA37_17030 [Acetobacteraceae bacterium]|nr:hypothetical protein [Acetobacteraceae bacterium]